MLRTRGNQSAQEKSIAQSGQKGVCVYAHTHPWARKRAIKISNDRLMLLMTIVSTLVNFAEANTGAAASSPFMHGSTIEEYFDGVKTGPGVWKWRNYFDVYERHLSRFRGTDVHLAEVGIYSGGSLLMWRNYFGANATLHGIDIANATLMYHSNEKYGNPRIHIGDQSDEGFWESFRERVPRLDILLDDGSHLFSGQNVTLTMMLDHMSPGGVYICEDIHHFNNHFLQTVVGEFVTGKQGLNVMSHGTPKWQRTIGSVSFYPYMVVIEKLPFDRPRMELQRHGTEWQPPCKPQYSDGRATACFANLGSQGSVGSGRKHG